MWFTEDAWSPIIVIAVAAIVCLIAWSSNQQKRYLVAILILLLAAVTTWFAEQAIQTDAEKLEVTLTELVQTFIEESQRVSSVDQVANAQSVRFFAESNEADRARVRAALVVASVNDDMRLADVRINLTDEDTAVTHFRANGTVTVSGGGRHYPSRWELTWRKEGGDWKVTQTKMLHVTTGEEQDIPRVD